MSQKIIDLANAKRRARGELDNLFVEYYLETSSPKHAYIRACNASGHDYKAEYAAQYGKSLFDRLKNTISDALDAAEVSDAALSRKVRREIAIDGKSESARLTAAQGLERKRLDKIEVTERTSLDDIDTQIIDIQRRIKTTTNDS